ncbi:hypothetical protein C8R46DRAFT_304319 [Mycena filopes]|nr:hypothetical protein C8R46DRAFT_304319 [Mycena filopes]
MADLLLLAALTVIATASFAPAPVLSRALRRVVQPAPAAIPPEAGNAPEKADSLCALLLRALTFVLSSLRVQSPAVVVPSVSSYSPDAETARVDDDASKVDAVESAAVVVDAPEGSPDATPPPLPPPHPTQCKPALRRTYVDFTIGWEDIWPEHQRAIPRKYAYNSYYNAYTLEVVPPEPIIMHPSDDLPPHDDDDDADASSDGDDTDSELDALELASRSEDEDLIWAFHSLSISEAASSPASCPKPTAPLYPPAGLSPFCPPPPRLPPTPSPPQQSTAAWRLEWY